MTRPSPAELAEQVRPESTATDIRRLRDWLIEQGTFRFPTLPSGLFSASAAETAESAPAVYQNAWIRDTVHIAHALWRTDQPTRAIRAVEALMTYLIRHQHRFTELIEGRADPQDPMQRPHVCFDGTHLAERPEKWAHAQNDALGAFLWIYCQMVAAEAIRPAPAAWSVLVDIPAMLRSVQFWQDEDSGHWEETRKIASSSIGVAVAGLQALRSLFDNPKYEYALAKYGRGIETWEVDWLIHQGRAALARQLPAECAQAHPSQHRRYDAALLFLVYPYRVVDDAMADQIVSEVVEHLAGPIGIRRYLGDSYWCADYKDLLARDQRSADFSDDLSVRDRLFQSGSEAQWCLFDPIVSIIHGEAIHRDERDARRGEQLRHLQRALRQLTPPESPAGGYRCPESYFRHRGTWMPNDITPLLWTQANLRLALELAITTAPQT